MNISKNPVLALSSVILFFTAFQIQAQSVVFFKDTVFEIHQVKVKIEKGFRKKGIIKLKILFTNLTENYFVINSPDIVVKTEQGEEIAAKLRKPIVIPPKDVVRTKFNFKGVGPVTTQPLAMQIKNINLTGTLVNSHNSLTLLTKLKTTAEDKNLHVEIVELKPKSKEYFVRISVTYNGPNILIIDYSKAQLLKSKKGDFQNIARGPGSYYTKETSQLMLLDFLCPNCYDSKNKPSIDLSNVFHEYAKQSLSGCDFKLTTLSGTNAQAIQKEKDDGIKEIE